MEHRQLIAAAGIISRRLWDLFRQAPENTDHVALVREAVRGYLTLEGAKVEIAEMATRVVVEPRLTYDLVFKGPQSVPTMRIAQAFADKRRESVRRCYYISNEMRQATASYR